MTELREVGAIVVHYYNYPDVIETLNDLESELGGSSNIVLINNGSSEGHLEQLRSRFPGLTLITGQGNVGYGAAVNLGIRRLSDAGLSLAIVCTHEVRLQAGVLANLRQALQDDSVGAAAPSIYRKSEPQRVWSFGGDLRRPSMVPVARTEWSDAAVDWVDGCFFMVRTEEFLRIGGMYEPYFLYMEEVDFFARLKLSGKRIVVARDAIAYQDSNGMGLYYATRNRILLARRLAPRRRVLAILASATARLCAEAVLFPGRRSKIRDRFRGIIEGVRVPADRKTVKG